VAAAILPPSKLSLLFLTTDLSLIAAWAGQLDPAIVHLGAAPELLSPADTAIPKSRLSGPLIMRSIPVVGETSIALARSYEGIAVSCSWTAIGHPIGRLALSECRMIGRSAGASMSKFRHLLSWPGVLDRIMSSRRSALYGLPASIQKPRPTGTGLTRRIWTE
jgi:hypothetical protein